MQDKTSNHAPIPTELNIAPRGKSWLHGQLIDGEQGHPTRQSMESADRAQAIEAAPAQAAPAAVAVPDGWKLVPVDLTPEMKREFMDLLMDGIDIYVNRRDQIEIQTDAPRRIWKAVLALAPSAPADALATATGLPAQAVPAFCHVASLKLKSLQERGYQITGYALEKPVEGARHERGFINQGGFVGWWWDGQSPQAQADARDAVLVHLDGLLDDAAAHIYPSDLNKFPTGEHTATVASVRMGNSSECSVPLCSREQVVEAFNTAQAAQGSEA